MAQKGHFFEHLPAFLVSPNCLLIVVFHFTRGMSPKSQSLRSLYFIECQAVSASCAELEPLTPDLFISTVPKSLVPYLLLFLFFTSPNQANLAGYQQ